jgi:hypothetical protein
MVGSLGMGAKGAGSFEGAGRDTGGTPVPRLKGALYGEGAGFFVGAVPRLKGLMHNVWGTVGLAQLGMGSSFIIRPSSLMKPPRVSIIWSARL